MSCFDCSLIPVATAMLDDVRRFSEEVAAASLDHVARRRLALVPVTDARAITIASEGPRQHDPL